MKLPDAVQEKLDHAGWGEILQTWADDSGDVYYFVTRLPDGIVNCLRIFRVGGAERAVGADGRWVISVDYQD